MECKNGGTMTYVGGCAEGCCDDYECTCDGKVHRIEWPD